MITDRSLLASHLAGAACIPVTFSLILFATLPSLLLLPFAGIRGRVFGDILESGVHDLDMFDVSKQISVNNAKWIL